MKFGSSIHDTIIEMNFSAVTAPHSDPLTAIAAVSQGSSINVSSRNSLRSTFSKILFYTTQYCHRDLCQISWESVWLWRLFISVELRYHLRFLPFYRARLVWHILVLVLQNIWIIPRPKHSSREQPIYNIIFGFKKQNQ